MLMSAVNFYQVRSHGWYFETTHFLFVVCRCNLMGAVIARYPTLSEAAVSSRTVVTFVTRLISRTEFSSSELVL